MASNFLESYEELQVIGNGSFGIIRKVNLSFFARKELNFERMTERDRKQIVAEVNILKDLHHDHIVRYHDRYVDRDAGILYILMEYCGGGDLSNVIKQAVKQNKPIPEDAVWGYFMQILLALNHCHNTGGHGRTGSAGSASDLEGKERRAQILHRDLKPDNVFLDEANTVKLGDFGLSKALAQTNFANTYVGVCPPVPLHVTCSTDYRHPTTMSPELMQEKAYDSKSDIWSLGCLIYELCALKPPFHEAKTHSELSVFIRNARIPPLPRGYSQALGAVIKAMLNLNPAMRPSAAQLLQHERLNTIKSHKATLTSKERDLLARESTLNETESRITDMIQQRDAQIQLLQSQLHESVKQREYELRVLVLNQEEDVRRSMQKREEEIMEAIRRREAEVLEEWGNRERELRAFLGRELEVREQMFEDREEELRQREAAVGEEEERLASVRDLLEKTKNIDEKAAGSKKDRSPLDEVQNILSLPFPSLALSTPLPRATTSLAELMSQPSAMKGVVLTATGEVLATPTPAGMFDLSRRFRDEVEASPKVGLNFAQVFDFDDGDDDDLASNRQSPLDSESEVDDENAQEAEVIPAGGSHGGDAQTTRNRDTEDAQRQSRPSGGSDSSTSAGTAPPTRLRPLSAPSTSQSHLRNKPKPLPHPHLASTASQPVPPPTARAMTLPNPRSHPSPQYDFNDEENLPSPFLKRADRGALESTTGTKRTLTKRPSSGNFLRVVAAANASAAGKRVTSRSTASQSSSIS
ncbi:kinase-like protein [Mycena rebaudengoi]|nr:kinase-like protein [Mycena rebaudengoi]